MQLSNYSCLVFQWNQSKITGQHLMFQNFFERAFHSANLGWMLHRDIMNHHLSHKLLYFSCSDFISGMPLFYLCVIKTCTILFHSTRKWTLVSRKEYPRKFFFSKRRCTPHCSQYQLEFFVTFKWMAFGHVGQCLPSMNESPNCEIASLKWDIFQMHGDLTKHDKVFWTTLTTKKLIKAHKYFAPQR